MVSQSLGHTPILEDMKNTGRYQLAKYINGRRGMDREGCYRTEHPVLYEYAEEKLGRSTVTGFTSAIKDHDIAGYTLGHR